MARAFLPLRRPRRAGLHRRTRDDCAGHPIDREGQARGLDRRGSRDNRARPHHIRARRGRARAEEVEDAL